MKGYDGRGRGMKMYEDVYMMYLLQMAGKLEGTASSFRYVVLPCRSKHPAEWSLLVGTQD